MSGSIQRAIHIIINLVNMSKLYIAYAGIGARATPRDPLLLMTEFARIAGEKRLVLRSGHASGADTAFEDGCDEVNGTKEIFVPWPRFRDSTSQYCKESCEQAYVMAKQIHPAWGRLHPTVRKLVARNMHQIMGVDFDSPVEFVVCWTPDAMESHTQYSRRSGGTGTALYFASMLNIPIYNFALKSRIIDAFNLLK